MAVLDHSKGADEVEPTKPTFPKELVAEEEIVNAPHNGIKVIKPSFSTLSLWLNLP